MVFPSAGDPSSTFLASSVAIDSFFRQRCRNGELVVSRREALLWIDRLHRVGRKSGAVLPYARFCPESGAVLYVRDGDR
jgi:hypothetical protein